MRYDRGAATRNALLMIAAIIVIGWLLYKGISHMPKPDFGGGKTTAATISWTSGDGVPGGSSGSVGDIYLDRQTGDVYKKTDSTTWTKQANLQGPKGDTGPQGPAGPQGPQGAPGQNGMNGTNGQNGADGTVRIDPSIIVVRPTVVPGATVTAPKPTVSPTYNHGGRG